MRRMGVFLAAVTVAVAVVAWAVTEARVIEREARVRAEKRKFGDSLVTLHEGDAVTVLSSDPPWVRVRKDTVEGWLHESAVTRDRGYVFSTAALVTAPEASERSAARKGFDAATEKSFRASKPELDKAFRLVDEIDAKRPDEGRLARFVADGELAGGAR